MKVRCYLASGPAFAHYGGRGIKVCDEWRDDYPAFAVWARGHGYSDTLEIDRIDNDGSYEPANCRWVIRQVNVANRRGCPKHTFGGVSMTLSEAAAMYGHSYSGLKYRIDRGMSPDEAIERPWQQSK